MELTAQIMTKTKNLTFDFHNLPPVSLVDRKGKNIGELEMRNDSKVHYREVRFNMLKPRVMKLLFNTIPRTGKLNDKVFIYGNAVKRFGRWSVNS